MSENSKKTRDDAETSFRKIQTPSPKDRPILSEEDQLIQARNVKTARLRELRLDKEANATNAKLSVKPQS